MAWRGNSENPVPNFVQEAKILNEKKIVANRADNIRRDTDKQKNVSIKLMDIDSAILKHIERLQLRVIDEGNEINVPVHYSSPEKWKSIQKDGFMRDYNGMIILPAIAFSRLTSDKDPSMMMFNRYLKYSVLKTYSQKNRYTPFNLLIGQNVPVKEIYNVVMPDHMIFTYKFIIWTEYVEQMNYVVERMNFESDDYWGDLRGLRFRTNVESFQHSIEIQTDQDRLVKTEFDLKVYGYLLPEKNYGLDGNKSTTTKLFAPKKIIMGEKLVGTDFSFDKFEKDVREKWRNQNYPNLPADELILQPPIVFNEEFVPPIGIKANHTEISSSNFVYVNAPHCPLDAPIALPVLSASFESFDSGWTYEDPNTEGFFLDVSTDELFTSFLPGYENLDVNLLTTKTIGITGAQDNINNLSTFSQSYFYRVRAYNSTYNLTSSYSNIISSRIYSAVAIFPGETLDLNNGPTYKTGTATPQITDQPFNIDFFIHSSGSLATEFFGPMYLLGDNFLISPVGFITLDVSNGVVSSSLTSSLVEGTTAGCTAIISTFPVSNIGVTLTSKNLLINPVAQDATSITNNSFTSNWYVYVNGATVRLDVATDIGFTNLVVNNQFVGAGIYLYNVTGLNSNTTYYYRLKVHTLSFGDTDYSNIISVTTL